MNQSWGPIFNNFYLSDLENEIFNKIKKPSIYLRSVDDISILANYINKINMLQEILKKKNQL